MLHTFRGKTPDGRASEDVFMLEPGDEITLVSVRPADVFKRDTRRREVMLLPAAPPKLSTISESVATHWRAVAGAPGSPAATTRS